AIDGNRGGSEVNDLLFGEFVARGFEDVIGYVALRYQRDGLDPGHGTTPAGCRVIGAEMSGDLQIGGGIPASRRARRQEGASRGQAGPCRPQVALQVALPPSRPPGQSESC